MPHARRVVVITLAIGLVVLLTALVVTLSHAAVRRTGSNYIRAVQSLGVTSGGGTFCQPDELAPEDTGAVRLSLNTGRGHGATVAVALHRAGELVARGRAPAGWQGDTVTVPLRPVLTHDVHGRLCVTLGKGAPMQLLGQQAERRVAARSGGSSLRGRLRVVYLRPHPESWWAFAPTVVDRMGLGHALHGSIVAILAFLLVLAAGALGTWQLVRASA